MPDTGRDQRATGYLLAFLCSLLSALMIVLIKWTGRHLPTLSILFLSQVIAGAVLTTVFLSRGGHRKLLRLPARGWAWLFGIVLLTFFAYWTFFAAIEALDPTVASFVGRAETVVTILLGVFLFKERLTRREVLGAAMVLAGVLILRFTAEVEFTRGLALCLVSAVLWGVTEALAKIALRHIEPFLFTWARCLLLIPAFGLAFPVLGEDPVFPETPGLWIGLIALAVSGPVIARYLYLKCLTMIPVSKAALINQFQPIWVAAIACTWLGTLPTPREWMGGLCILSGCALLVWMRSGQAIYPGSEPNTPS